MYRTTRGYLASIKRRIVHRLIRPTTSIYDQRIAELEAKIENLSARLAAQPEPIDPAVFAKDERLALLEKYAVAHHWRTLDLIYDRELRSRELACIICGESGDRDHFEIVEDQCAFGGARLERYRCPSCECVFGAQKFIDLPPELVDLDYRLLYSRYREGDTTDNEVRTFHSLNPERGKTYLNWGSGGAWNRTIAVLRAEGWDIWGYEPSASGGNDFVIAEKAALPEVDGIISNNVIEHFFDPVQQFREFHALLKPGALMAHSTACYDYLYPFSRFHTVFLLGKSPEVLAQRSGFEIVSRERDGEYINVVFRRI